MNKIIIQVLQSDFLQKGRYDDDLKYRLAKANKVKLSTIDRWYRDEDTMLTTATNLEIMRSHFGLPGDSVLVEPKEIEPEETAA